MLGSRTFSGRLLWQGNQVGCYNCHNGPDNGDGNGTTPAVASNGAATTTQETQVDIPLQASGSGLTYRTVSQPSHGTVVIQDNVATYLPAASYVGNDLFKFAANNGSVDSNLGTISVSVTPGDCTLTASTLVPFGALPDLPVPFRAAASLTQCAGSISYDWDYGDGTPHQSGAHVAHVYHIPGDYTWSLTASANGTSEVVTGVLTISLTLGQVVDVTLTPLNPWELQVSWPVDRIPTSLESAADLFQPYPWALNIYPAELDATGQYWTVTVDLLDGNHFWRVRKVP